MEKTSVCRHESELVDARRRRDEAIRRVLVRRPKTSALDRHLVIEAQLTDGGPAQLRADPRFWIGLERDAAALREQKGLPDGDRREPFFVRRVADRREGFAPKPLWLEEGPEPDVGVEQQLHARKVSQSSAAIGETRSPVMVPLPAAPPSQSSRA